MNSLIFFFSALGVFNGFLLVAYLLFFSKNKSLSNNLLGGLVLALSLRIGKSIILYFDPDVHKLVLQIGLSACLFIGPLLFFYIKAVSLNITTIPKLWTLSLGLLLLAILVVGFIRPYHHYPVFWNAYVVHTIYLIWFLSIIAASISISPVFKKTLRDRTKLNSLEKWLSVIYLGNVIIAGAFFMAIFGSSMAYYITGPLVFSFFLYLLAFGYFNNRWFDLEDKPTLEKYRNKKIEPTEAQKLLIQLDELMSEHKLYTNPHLKLKDVADRLSIPSHQLSQLLNDNLGKGYKTYINELRISAACEMLGVNELLSLEGIGYDVGFRSKSTFFTTFKKVKECTPAQFRDKSLIKTS